MYPRLRALREDNDLKQAQPAAVLSMSQKGHPKYETGENDIPTRILVKLAEYYHTSVDYLLGVTDRREPYPTARRNRNERSV